MYLIFPLTAYVVQSQFGFDLNPAFDKLFEKMHEVDDSMAKYSGINLLRWASPIETYCYTCFGTPVALKEVLTDFWSIKSIGDMIAYDFSVRMPIYMKNAIPPAKAAGKAFDKAMGSMPP
jgi:hypothetical protein